jgi:hypothetical protein
MTTMNGTKNTRPTLSNQIDRLDTILDGLAEALNESVADAVRGVVGQTVPESVEEAVREVLARILQGCEGAEIARRPNSWY